jgi:hypothetical protein
MKWRKRLELVTAGVKPKDWPAEVCATTDSATPDDCGFYRLAIKERVPLKNGQGTKSTTVGYEPVMLVVHQGELTAIIGDQTVRGSDLHHKFLWFVSFPISRDWYVGVTQKGQPWQWPDAPKEVIAIRDQNVPIPVPAANREVEKTDNIEPEVAPEVEHATGIDNAISAALKKVANETEAAQALGSKNRIAELRLAADKAGKALYQPLYQQYQSLYSAWNPMVKRAEAAEKVLNTAILTFRESERKRVVAEQEAADARQREIDEANERAAQRAIASAEPEPAPIAEEVEQPAPLAPIAPTYGTRKIKEEVKHILESVTDFAAVYTFLKDEPKVKALLTELAAAKIKAGFAVPGTVTREGLI